MPAAFRGIVTPLVTPIGADESPDLASLRRLVALQLDKGVHGIWAMGTTAEFASFDEGERAAVVETVVRAVAGRVPVVANVSDASTRLAIRHARRARDAGADAIAATPPYYYPHSQDELLLHYRTLREAIDLPLFIYNIPQTVRVRTELATAQALAAEGTVAGIKDSQNDLEWFRQLTLFARERGLDFAAFAGTRYLIDAAILAGACGAIPSIANAFPDLCVTAFEAMARGDLAASIDAEARIIRIESVATLLGQGSRNAAILGYLKAVLWRRGIIENPALTAPLRTPTPEEREILCDRVEEAVCAFAG
ncbi:MAG: dihydrodipicolinate synthase family protein [Chloroflexi bacterium]|nr:dihydrodipicolinate synthase family protein [Chloroflexota bacterium]